MYFHIFLMMPVVLLDSDCLNSVWHYISVLMSSNIGFSTLLAIKSTYLLHIGINNECIAFIIRLYIQFVLFVDKIYHSVELNF
jgi:hypothetical protein